MSGCLTSPDKAQAPGKGVAFFADVHRTKKNGEGFRITYTVDGLTFKHVDDFKALPAKDGDRVFIDILPIQHTDGAIELLRRGVEVYCLRRLTLVKKRREELKMSKTTKNDIKTLMSIGERWFRRLTEDFLVMRRLITTYRTLARTHKQYITRYRAVSEKERSLLKAVIKALEEQMDDLARQIAEEAGERYPAYNKLVEELDIAGNTTAMEALAELVVYLDPDKGFLKTANYLGLFKPVRGKMKIYDGRLRQTLQRLTATTNRIKASQLTAKMERETLAKIWRTCRQETRGRLAIPAQG